VLTRDHDVQLYEDSAQLAGSVAAYFAAGLLRDENAVALARPEHCEAFSQALAERGCDVEGLSADGRLLFLDADEVLAKLFDGEQILTEQVAQEIPLLLDLAAGPQRRRVRAYGELVDLLCERGHPEAAHVLEEQWNLLLAKRNFFLYCGYRVDDPFSPHAHSSLVPQVCRTHSRVIPAGDPQRFKAAVDAALAETIGPGDAGRVYELAGAGNRGTRVPAPQLALVWLSAHMPETAEQVLARAREHYAAA
jgi:hypothetical protein